MWSCVNSQLLLGIILGAALLIGLVARNLLAPRKRLDINTEALRSFVEFPAVVVFGSHDCVSCAPVIAALHKEGITFRELSWEKNARQIEELQILQVPTTWAVDGDGRIRLAVEGPLTKRQLRTLKLQNRR